MKAFFTQKFVSAAIQMKSAADMSSETRLTIAVPTRARRRMTPARYRTTRSSGVDKTTSNSTTMPTRKGTRGTTEQYAGKKIWKPGIPEAEDCKNRRVRFV